MLAGALAATAPDPDAIRQVAREVVHRPHYQLESGTDHRLTFWAWLLDALRWLARPLLALFDVLHAISPVLAWLFVALLVVILVVLVAHIIYTFKQALGRRRSAGLERARDAAPLDPAVLEARAREAAAAGDYIGAVRALFRSCLLRLQKAERRPLRRGITNRELLRRYQSSSIAEALRTFVETIDHKWYGGDVCTSSDYEQCAEAHAQIRRSAGELAHADRA